MKSEFQLKVCPIEGSQWQHSEREFRQIFLTCRDNKEQQINVELHFQSWDISVLLPNPYRCFQIHSLCAVRRGRAERNCSPAFLRTVPTKPERRQKLSSSIISSERKPPLVCLSGRTARNETHVCPTQCPLCGVGRGASRRLQAARLLRAVVWIYRHFQRWEEGIQRWRRELVFTRCLNVTQETFNHRRHEDMRGQGRFISAFTSTPRWVSDRAVKRWSRLCLSLSFCSLPV